MGKMKWGGYCPSYMSWNSHRVETGMCSRLEHHLYSSWYNHGLNGYISSGNPWRNFSCFVTWCYSQPWWSNFACNHTKYEFDKDTLGRPIGTTEFCDATVTLLTKSQNAREANMRTQANRYNGLRNSIKAKQASSAVATINGKNSAKPVMINGIVYSSRVDAAQSLGVHHGTITRWVQSGKAVDV